MEVFYANPDYPDILNAAETHHCINVKRHRIDDIIHVVDGLGKMFQARIIGIEPQKTILQLLSTHLNWGEIPFDVSLAFSPLKSRDRNEWLIEKAVELGVRHLWPIQTFHSERKLLSIDRLDKIIMSTIKQSKRSFLPICHPLLKFQDFLLNTDLIPNTLKIIAFCQEEFTCNVQEVIRPNHNLMLIIGPEGDFTKEEIHQSMAADFIPVSFGTQRLRSETAALYALSLFKFLNS